MIVAIDGTAGSGKSTIAEMVSLKFDFVNINSGNLYRAIAYSALKNEVDVNDPKKVEKMLSALELKYVDSSSVRINRKKVDSSLLHTVEVDNAVSHVSNYKFVRDRVNAILNDFAKKKNVVCEGRDIGSVVFPNADVKIYMDADIKTRAMRRSMQYNVSHDKIISDLIVRDREDKNREYGALVLAEGAVKIDSTNMSTDEIYKKVAHLIRDVQEQKE